MIMNKIKYSDSWCVKHTLHFLNTIDVSGELRMSYE